MSLSKHKSIAVIFAQLQEIEDFFLRYKPNLIEKKDCAFRTWFFKNENTEFFFVLSGIGKMVAAAATQFVISNFNVTLVINIGVVGALGEELKTLDPLIVNSIRYFDVDLQLFDKSFGQADKTPETFFVEEKFLRELRKKFSYFGEARCYSSDSFVTLHNPFLDEMLKFEKENSKRIIFDMELAAIAHICSLNNRKFFSLKIVSDTIKLPENNFVEYCKNLPICQKFLSKIILELFSIFKI